MPATDPIVYDVHTSADPATLNDIGIEIFRLWVEFALGARRLGGKMIAHPTGRYAASLSYRRYGESRVAIIADERIAPEAGILETGHGRVDLKQKLQMGRTYPMHRGTMGAATPGMSVRAPGGKVSRISHRGAAGMWATARESGFAGFATVGTAGWIIPAMPAYAPARILAHLAALRAT